MSEDYKPGKFEDGFVLSEKEFSKSVTLTLSWFRFVGSCVVSSGVERRVESIERVESNRVGSSICSVRRCGEDMSQIYGFFFCVIPHS